MSRRDIADCELSSAPGTGTSGATRRWWVLVVMCIAQLMVILDATIVNIALPSAQRSLGFSAADRQWILTAYALAFGSLLLIGGRVANLIGRRNAVLIGLAGFGLASALGGAAVSFPMLVIARAVQGVFSALLAPATLAVISTTFPDNRERGKAFGIFGSVSAGGAATGLLLGGVLTEYETWRWTLYVNTALAVVGIIGVMIVVLGRQARAPWQRPDVAGTAVITAGLFGLVFGFSYAYQHGWADTVTLLCLIGGAVLILGFLVIEARAANPILPLRVLASRVRGACLLAIFLGGVGLYAEFLFLTYYLQEVLGFSPVQAGLAFLPQTAGTVVAASLGSGILLRRLSPAVLMPAGLLMAAGGTFLLSHIGMANDYSAIVLPGVILNGAGLGLALTIAINQGISGVTDDDAGVASAVVNAMQQVGGSIGPSLFNTIAGSVVAAYLVSHAWSTGTVGNSAVLAAAQVHSYTVAFIIAAAIQLAGALVSAALLNWRPRRSARLLAAAGNLPS
jgi:EmrB/QacA subfamily drug resistance transporter